MTYVVSVTAGYSEQIVGPYVNVGVVVPATGVTAGDTVVSAVDAQGTNWTSAFLPVAPANNVLAHWAYPSGPRPPDNAVLTVTMT